MVISETPSSRAQDALEEVCRHEWKMHLRVPFLQLQSHQLVLFQQLHTHSTHCLDLMQRPTARRT